MNVYEEDVDDFLEHHGVVGMKKGFPKTDLHRISRMARGTSKLKATIQKAQSDAAKVEKGDKATLVVDSGPTKRLPKIKEPTSTDEDPGESLAEEFLKKLGATRMVDLRRR